MENPWEKTHGELWKPRKTHGEIMENLGKPMEKSWNTLENPREKTWKTYVSQHAP